MALITLEGPAKDAYYEMIVEYIDRLESHLTIPNSLSSVRSILQTAHFGRDMAALRDVTLHLSSGLPTRSVLDTLQVHKQRIESEDIEADDLSNLIESIQDSIYSNKWNWEGTIKKVKNCLFVSGLQEAAFSSERTVTLLGREALDQGSAYSVLVDGYDLERGSWLRYEADLYTEDKGRKLRKYIGSNLWKNRDERWLQPALTDILGSLFGHSIEYWMQGIDQTNLIKLGRRRKQHIVGFYGPHMPSAHQQFLVDGESLLIFEEDDWEDTDLTLVEEFDPKFYLKDDYTPEAIREKRQWYVTGPQSYDKICKEASREARKVEVVHT